MLLSKLGCILPLMLGAVVAALPPSTTCSIVIGWTGEQTVVTCEGTCTTFPAGPCDDVLVYPPQGSDQPVVMICMCGANPVETTCDQYFNVTGGYAWCRFQCTESGGFCQTSLLPPKKPGVPWASTIKGCIGC